MPAPIKIGPAGVSIQPRYNRCVQPGCKCRKPGAQGHGPYLYAWWRQDGRMRSKYIGHADAEPSPSAIAIPAIATAYNALKKGERPTKPSHVQPIKVKKPKVEAIEKPPVKSVVAIDWSEHAPTGAMLPPADAPRLLPGGPSLPMGLYDLVRSLPEGTVLDSQGNHPGPKRLTREEAMDAMEGADGCDEPVYYKAHTFTREHNGFIATALPKKGPALFKLRTPEGILWPEYGF